MAAVGSSRKFLTVARHRLGDARVLFERGRHPGAVYLAGYAVECGLKALILSRTSPTQMAIVEEGFRGRRGHDLRSLLQQSRQAGANPISKPLVRRFSEVQTWTSEVRYDARPVKPAEASRFLEAVGVILDSCTRLM